MKSYQLVYKDSKSFKTQLLNIKKECQALPCFSAGFYIVWVPEARETIPHVTDCIDEMFPDSIYYGNEAAGSIQKGKLTYEITVTLDIFEDADTKMKMLWFEEGSDLWQLDDLWKVCKKEKGLRAVEILPSIAYNIAFEIDNSVPDISEDILVFGGVSVNNQDETQMAGIMAKGHPITMVGMVAILYYGENLNLSSNYVLGWKGLGKLMQITKSTGNIISEIDGIPTKKVFEKYLGPDEGDKGNLIFPLMLVEDNTEFIRSSQAFLPDDSMVMFAKVPEKSLVRIAYGDKNTILRSLLAKSTEIAAFKPQVLKAFSCTARRIFWGDDEIHKETVALQEIAPINGFYTGGEILRFGKKIRVLNQTLVTIGFREGDGSDMAVKQIPKPEKNDKSLLSRITYFLQVVADEQKEALEVAQEEKRRNDVLHNIIHSGGWSFRADTNDKIVDITLSDEVKRIVNFDFEGDDVISEWVNHIHQDDKENTINSLKKTIVDHSCNTPYDVTYRMIDKNGEYHWFHSAGQIVRDEKGEGEFFGVHINITDQIEEQIQTQKQLQDALIMADSANHAKTEFLFNMSHDIRTPMNAILGFTNMAMKYSEDKEKLLDCLGKIQSSGDLLLSLINNVLEVSRIESGKAVVDQKPGDVYSSFDSIESTMLVMAQSKDIQLKFEYGEIKDRYIYCDFTRCARVFVNIISNAIKYTQDGGFVNVKCEQIKGKHRGYGLYRYTFEDNGFGMSEEFQKHVFEQFSRENNATVTGIQGTGLGMAVCKSFVDIMNGTIECKSKVGEGTTFTVTLPFKLQSGVIKVENKIEKHPESNSKAKAEAKSAGGKTEEPKEPRKIDFNGKKILVVEDNVLNREIAVEILQSEGMVTEEAVDGSEAVQMLKNMGSDYYDCILMDIQMPVMNGYEAAKAIREMYPDGKLPIIALSANAFAEDKEASIKAGMNAHVAKPINVQELFSTMSELL